MHVRHERVFQEKLSGATRERPALADMLDFVRDGDTVYKIGRAHV